jgi:hypothetical protein
MKHESHTKETHTKKHSSNTTTDLNEIKKWAEARQGKPVIVKGTGGGKDDGGVLRIDFPGFRGEDTFEEVSWDEWYKIFKSRDLAFLYQDKTSDGKESRFFKLINNE